MSNLFSVINSLSGIESIFLILMVLCGLWYFHFFINYLWQKDQLYLLRPGENLNLIPYTFWGGLVCILTVVPLMAVKESKTFAISMILLLLAATWSKYFYFRSLRKLLQAYKFDRFYKIYAIVACFIAAYYILKTLQVGTASIYNLESVQVSESVLRSALLPFDFTSEVKIVFLPNYIFSLLAYFYLLFKSYKRREYLICFGVFFTLFSILFTNSYHIFNFEFWIPMNVIADVFELFRLNLVQRQKLQLALERKEQKLSELEMQLDKLKDESLDHKVFKHDLSNSFMVASLHLKMAKIIMDSHSEVPEDFKKALMNASIAQEAAVEFFNNSRCGEQFSLLELISKLERMLDLKIQHQLKEDMVLRFDRNWMQNILVNLLKNSIEANLDNEHFWVRLEVKQEGDSYFFWLVDSGLYHNIQDREKIFDQGVSSKGQKGRGLGLYSVRKILREHQGNIQLIDWNQHTCFHFHFKACSRENFK